MFVAETVKMAMRRLHVRSLRESEKKESKVELLLCHQWFCGQKFFMATSETGTWTTHCSQSQFFLEKVNKNCPFQYLFTIIYYRFKMGGSRSADK